MNTNGRPVTIVDRHAAEALAEQILAPRRLFPLVVVTTPAGRTDPYVPATELIDAISQRADVVSVTQQASNWLSTRLEELGRSDLNVYGGATRLYPTGPLDADLAPIFTARTEADGVLVVANVSKRVGGTFTTSTPERRDAFELGRDVTTGMLAPPQSGSAPAEARSGNCCGPETCC